MLGLIGIGSFVLGLAVRDYFATSRDIERIEESIKTHITLMVLHEAHNEAVAMLGENEQMEEFTDRVQARLDELSEEMNEQAELAEIDPIGARVLGDDRDPVRFPPEEAD